MDNINEHRNPARIAAVIFAVLVSLTIAAFVGMQSFQASSGTPSSAATYSRGLLHLTISYHAAQAGSGQLTMEVLDPEDNVLGRAGRHVDVAEGQGRWQDEIKLEKPLPLDDLVWHRVRYRFEYDDKGTAALEGTESISQILRTPVIHILGQQSYLSGGQAAVRVIVTDSKNEVIGGRGSVRIELVVADGKPRLLFTGQTNRRGTTEAQFRFPASLVGSYQLRYVVDTPIGSTEFTQEVRLEDKVSILLTTEKPIYQPGQTIHVRSLALDRSDHEAAAKRKLTFELEDSRGNKVFKKATETDQFGVASAEFGLADEVNLGTYRLRALMGDAEAPSNTAEIALNVERYVLPKFKVAVEFGETGKKQKRGYQPGDHVTGTVRSNYFFGKPVDHAEISVKASAMDVAMFEVASAQGKTDSDGSYRFDIQLPKYFAGRPLSHGAARVLIEATVKDSAGHAETRGEPITVSESPLLITAVPEGGTLVPNLENQVFILTSYPDGTPAKTELTVHAAGNADQRVTTDEGGVAVTRVKAGRGSETLEVDATDQEGSHASSKVHLEARNGEDQILLRTERAVYRAGERIQLKVFSTKARGAAYVDIVKEGQTVLTRDLELENGEAELSLTATLEMAGTVGISAYLFGRDARPVGDHRLIFVQPADELKIETVADAPVYKPAAEARIQFRVTNSRGQGVHAALGLQVVDEAVFALAEKQPGFAKVFFYLEQEVMKPRYEIHSIGMPEIVEPVEKSQSERRDRAARVLFSATEMVDTNKFETEFGKDVPMAKYGEYAGRYQVRFQEQASQLAKILSHAYEQNPKLGEPARIYAKLARTGGVGFRDPWGTSLTFEPARWDSTKSYYLVRSAGPDRQLNTGDDLQAFLLFHRRKVFGPPSSERTEIAVNIEHDRGAFNGQAAIAGTVTDPTGAAIADASVEARNVSTGKIRTARTNAAGQFSLSGLAVGDYIVQVSVAGFKIATRALTLQARDRAVLSATLAVGNVTEAVEVSAQSMVVQTEGAALAAPMPGGAAGGVIGGMIDRGRLQNLPLNGRNVTDLAVLEKKAAVNSATLAKDESGSPAAHVRSYFPEALYINPEIITDKDGRASIVIPMADSITTWRMAMIASTQHGALGTSTSSLKVFQDFFVDLDLPVTLTQGDRVSLPVAIYNYSGSTGDVNLRLEADNWFSLVDDVGEKSVTVESSRVGGSQFTLEARRIGKFKLTLSARMKGKVDRADIVVREIEVIPNGREQTQVFNGRLENTVQHEIDFPANAIPEASKIFVRLYPGPLSQVIEGMDSILQMPGGCFEQTSSSTYPNVLALDYMKRTKKLTPEVHAKAEGYIANGYQRLLTFEVLGGGFSWFGSAPANKILTAYGLMEFSDMSKVYDVDPKLISRTQQWLAGQQQEDGSWKPDTSFINEGATNRYNSDVLRITAYIAWSLGNTGYEGTAVERAKQFVEKHMSGKIDTYTLAVVANFAADYGKDRQFTRQAMQLLLDARTEKGEQVWWSADETAVYATGESASVETTGLAVQALLKWGEASGTARKAMSYIAAKKDAGGTWGTTQATIMALRALLLATEKGAADVRGTLLVLLNGKPVEKLALTPENNDLLHQFVFKGIDSQKTSTVEIQFDGKGGLAYLVVGWFFLPWDLKPAGEPLSIDVAYDRTQLAQDDIATAIATVRNNLDKTANMVMVDLGIPPGFDLLSEDLQAYQEKSVGLKSGHLSKFSLTATQAILYFDSFAPGDTVTLKFRLRAKYPIRARTFRSRVYEYYDPEVSSIARPVQIEVRKRSGRRVARRAPPPGHDALDGRDARRSTTSLTTRSRYSWRTWTKIFPMSDHRIAESIVDAEDRFEGFETLMPFKVQNILLVSSLYDSFILREDGRLNELLIDESLDLNLQQIPGITHVSSCAEAAELARSQPRFNLIVTNLAVGDMDAAQLAREVKQAGLDVPVVVLAYDYRAIKNFVARNPVTDIERVFLWQGNARILISIVKYIEDKRNVLHDTRAMGVPVLLVVEDNIRYYSSFLPVIYTELIKQSRRVIQEGLNVAHKLVRMQARPRILLSTNFEDAARLVQEYRNYLFGVVSDVEFPFEGKLSPEAGFELARMVKSLVPDAPVVLQTSRAEFRPRAQAEGYSFLRKRSPTLLKDLRHILTEQFGFGDFVFRLPDASEVGRAKDMNELEEQLQTVPAESIVFHSQSNHFSHWLMARTEFALAAKLRPRKVTDFASPEHLRRDLIESIHEYRREQSEVLIGDFRADTFQPSESSFLRIGSGSLGGKARGLAFVRHLLRKSRMARRFPGVRILVPPAVVLATDVFDQFVTENNLFDFALHCEDDAEIQRRFLAAPLSNTLNEDLKSFLAEVTHPLAVRSSSLLEDSQYQPFTGVYETFMLGNQQAHLHDRLTALSEAIRRVYASTFSRHAKSYVRATPYRLEEEKMAVILQQVVGTPHGQRFYPDFSGVVRSHNFYPVPPMAFEDGIAAVALGLGRAVVDGGKCLTFCPRYPQNLVQFSSVEDILSNSQTEFWALELDGASEGRPGHWHERRFGLDAAESDGTLRAVASTYSKDNHAVYDGVSRPGSRIVTFAPMLKHGTFPLAEILDDLVRAGEDALGNPVEIEFAVRMPQQSEQAAEFGFLQIRPLTLARDSEDLALDDVRPEQLICRSSKVLGNGRIEDLHDVIVVDSQRFERSRSQEVSEAVAKFNRLLNEENRPYLLIGVGRWGSTEPWLGIPVEWDEISGARVIVEAGFRDFRVTPSQGSHFFQNLTAFQIGYFTVNPDAGEGSVDWQWLTEQAAVEEQGCVRHLQFAEPIRVVMNSRTSQGVIFKPEVHQNQVTGWGRPLEM